MSLNGCVATFHDLTTAQLRQAVLIREQIESLQGKLDVLLGGSTVPTEGKRTVSAVTKKKMAAAQQARRAKAATILTAAKEKAGLTAAGRTKLSAAMKARWAARRAAE